MNNSDKKRILYIINPKSWEKGKKETMDKISGFSEKLNLKAEIYYTKKEDTSAHIGNEIKKISPVTVVAAGGDGTVNMVATQLINSDIRLGIIPSGSANGLAFNLGIHADEGKAMDIIENGKVRTLDVIQLNENEYCYHLSDIGINARIVHRFEKEGSRGLIGYGKQMLKELFSRHDPFSFNLKAGDLNKKYKAEMLVIANAKSFGTGATINPSGKPDDGIFELVVIKPYPWWILGSLVVRFFTGNLDKLKYVDIIQVKKAKILLDRPRSLQNDGEISEGIKELDLKIIPSALNVLVP